MAYTIEYNHPDFDKGEEFDVTGVGLIKNGGTVKLDEEAERSFVATTGRSVKDYFKGNANFKLTGTTELKSNEKEGGE
jgi:hypothetical protein